MIHRIRRHASFYTLRELLNDTVRLSDRPPEIELIWSPESKFHPEFGDLRESDLVGSRNEIPSLIMSFLILGSVIIAMIAIYVKYLVLERRIRRQIDDQRKQSETTILPETDDSIQGQTSRNSDDRRKSILNVFREFRL